MLAALAISSTQAQITVDGVRDGSDVGYTAQAVQSTTSGWGANNALANLHTAQDGANLAVFIAGRPQGNAILLFIDSKAGGVSFIPNNLISTGGDEYTINNLGTSTSAGLTFEDGFEPDYAVRIYGDGGGTDTYVNRYNLQTGVRSYVGEAGTTSPATSGFVTAIRSTWVDASPPYDTAVNGVEMKLSLATLGVPTGTAQPVKMMAVLVNGGSDYASNQVLASRTSSTADIGGAINSINFETEADVQTISITVDNEDTDNDGLPNNIDPDDDNDGLLDTEENGSGIYNSPTDTGTDPLVVDTDGDGASDFDEVNSPYAFGFLTDPNIANFASMAVPGNFTTPQWQVDGSADNAMTRVDTSLLNQNQWTLDYQFYNTGDIEYKYAANGAYTNSWPGGNVVSNIPATGFYTFTFDNETTTGSLGRKVFVDVAAFLTAYGQTSGTDDDGDNILNEAEYAANTDPTNIDSDGDGLNDDEDPDPLVPLPQNRDVIFQVDMNVQLANGNFNPATGNVVVKIFSGSLAGGGDLLMTDINEDGIYETDPVNVVGAEGSNFGNFKFFNTTPAAPNSGYEDGFDRNFALGPDGVTQYAPDPVVYFSNDSTFPDSYATWAGASGYNLAPKDGRNHDADDDGFTNFQEFLFGTVPNVSNGSLVTTTAGAGNIVLSWNQRDTDATYTLLENMDLGEWLPSGVSSSVAADQSGVPSGYTRMEATVPTANPKTFFRVKGEDGVAPAF